MLYGPQQALDEDNEPLPDTSDPSQASNLNPCGNLTYCRTQSVGKTFWAVNYWMGAGFVYQAFPWLKLRSEFSSTTLKAANFPRATYESISATIEIHFY